MHALPASDQTQGASHRRRRLAHTHTHGPSHPPRPTHPSTNQPTPCTANPPTHPRTCSPAHTILSLVHHPTETNPNLPTLLHTHLPARQHSNPAVSTVNKHLTPLTHPPTGWHRTWRADALVVPALDGVPAAQPVGFVVVPSGASRQRPIPVLVHVDGAAALGHNRWVLVRGGVCCNRERPSCTAHRAGAGGSTLPPTSPMQGRSYAGQITRNDEQRTGSHRCSWSAAQ